MIVILNTKFAEKQKLYKGLSKIFGIGYSYSKSLCERIGVSENAFVADIDVSLIKVLLKCLNAECLFERELQGRVLSDIQNKIKLKTYQGRRHMQGLPVHGQNTKNNSKTAKKLLKDSGRILGE